MNSGIRIVQIETMTLLFSVTVFSEYCIGFQLFIYNGLTRHIFPVFMYFVIQKFVFRSLVVITGTGSHVVLTFDVIFRL